MKIIGIDDGENIKKINKKKIMIVSIIAIVLLALLVIFITYCTNKQFRDIMDKYVLMKNVIEDTTKSIMLDENENNNIYANDKYISILNNNTLKNYNSLGKLDGELTVEISTPITSSNGRFLLIAEKGQNKIYLISGNEIIWKNELEGNIDKIKVNKNGYVAVILSGTTHKSVIETFDSSGKELFKTYLANTIAMDADISLDNQYMAFSEINTSGTQVQSIVKIVAIQKAKSSEEGSIIYTYQEPNGNLITNIKYQEQNRLICMYNDGIYVIKNETNEKIVNFVEDNVRISFADIELNNHVFRVVEKTSLLSTQTNIEIINTNSKKTNIYSFDGALKEICSYNDKISVNMGSEVHFISTNGWLIKKYISKQEIKKVVISNNFAGIVYRGKIEIVDI